MWVHLKIIAGYHFCYLFMVIFMLLHPELCCTLNVDAYNKAYAIVYYVSKCMYILYVCILKHIFCFLSIIYLVSDKTKTLFLTPDSRIVRCLYNNEFTISSWIILTSSVFAGRSKQKGALQPVSLPKEKISMSFKEK